MAATASKPNIFIRVKIYIQEVLVEMEKVTWPSREDLKAHTVVVLIFLLILAVAIGLMDVGFQQAVLSVFRLM